MWCMNLHDYLLADNLRQTDLAELIGAHPVLVSQWVNGVRRIPAERCPAIERATAGAVRCEDLRPDVDWGYLRGTASTQEQAA